MALLSAVQEGQAARDAASPDAAVVSQEPDPIEEGPPARRRLGPFAVEGEVSAGVRFVDVDGNERQYEEETNLDSGLLLRDFRLIGERSGPDGWLDSFLLSAEGIGDPFSAYRAEGTFGPWRAFGRYDRSEYVGNTGSDIHAFDLTREGAAIGLERDWERGRAGIELTHLNRDGLSIGTRNVGFEFVGGFPRLTDHTQRGVRGDLSVDMGWATMVWAASYENLQAEDRIDFAEPSPSFPTETLTEDFDGDTDGRVVSSSVRLRREGLDGRLELDLGGSWTSTDQDGTFRSFETGFFFDPSLPFERETVGDMNMDVTEWDVDLGAAYQLDRQTDVYGRVTHVRQERDGRLIRDETLDELMGGPPSVSTFVSEVDSSSRLDLFELGAVRSLATWADLDVRVLYGVEDLAIDQTEDAVVIRRFDDDVDEYGAEATLAMEAGREVQVDITGGYGVATTETPNIGVAFSLEDERSYHAELSARWKPSARASFYTTARHEKRENDAFDSEGRTDRLSVSASTRPLESLALDASFSYFDFDLTSNTNFVFFDPTGFRVVPAVVTFDSIQRTWTAWMQWEASSRFQPRMGASAILSSGQAAFDYGTLRLELPYRLSPVLEVGLDLAFIDFDATGQLSGSSHEDKILTVYARRAF